MDEKMHTPGPWLVKGQGIVSAGGKAIAVIVPHIDKPDGWAAKHNGAVLAAAPSTLEACADLVALIEAVAPTYAECSVVAFARAAIAKSSPLPSGGFSSVGMASPSATPPSPSLADEPANRQAEEG